MADFSYEIINHIGAIGEPTPSGWQTHLTFISFNGREPKYDIRSWNSDMSRMAKGVSLTEDEFKQLLSLGNSQVGSVDESYAPTPSDDDLPPLTREEMLSELKGM